VTETRYSDDRLIETTHLPEIMKTLQMSIYGAFNINEIIESTALQEWKVTPPVKISSITRYPTLKDIHSLEIKGDEIE